MENITSAYFDYPLVRRGTGCAKWDTFDKIYGREDLIHAGCADMDFRSSPAVIAELTAAAQHGTYGYTDLQESFYEGIMQWYQRRHHLQLQREAIVFTPRINIACGLCIEALTRPGDKVILSAPAYPPLAQAAEDNGRFVLTAGIKEQDDRYVLDLEGLEKQMDDKCKFMILVNPHNPTTRAWSYEELDAICDFCLKHDLYLFVDEIHCDFLKAGCTFHSILECRDKIRDKLILASSPAKTFNVMGALVAFLYMENAELRARFHREIQRIGEHNPTLFANALMRVAYQQGEEYVNELNRYIDVNENYLRAEFMRLFPELVIKPREGTYLLWMDFTKCFASEQELSDFFINEARVEVYFGSHFAPEFAGFVRFNMAAPMATMQEVISRIEEALHRRAGAQS